VTDDDPELDEVPEPDDVAVVPEPDALADELPEPDDVLADEPHPDGEETVVPDPVVPVEAVVPVEPVVPADEPAVVVADENLVCVVIRAATATNIVTASTTTDFWIARIRRRRAAVL
jgi:hypothetical protein